MLRRLRSWFSPRPALRDVLIGVAFGAAIEFIALPHFLHGLSVVRRTGDDNVDRMIRLAQRVTGVTGNATPFVFIDINDAVWAEWKTPPIAPRAKLAELILRAAESDPALIFLDVDLSFPSGFPADEGTLKKMLENYGTQKRPPLLLIRPLISPPPGSGTALPKTRQPFFGLPGPPLGSLDGAGINWVSSQFDKDGDGVVRRWRLYETVCGDAEGPAILPSLHLAAALLLLERRDPKNASAAMQKLRALAPGTCAGAQPMPEPEPVTLHEGTPRITTADKGPGSRVIYTTAWRDGAAALGPTVQVPSATAVPLVAVRPASALLKFKPGEAVEGLKGRIVVIGGSYHDSGDWHSTPLGEMPGALIAVNAIHTMLEHGTPHEPEAPLRIGLAFTLVVIVALLFAKLRPVFAGLAATLITLTALVASVSWFKSGVVLDLAVPSIGVILHNLLVSLTDIVKNLWHHGFGWVRRPME